MVISGSVLIMRHQPAEERYSEDKRNFHNQKHEKISGEKAGQRTTIMMNRAPVDVGII